MGKEGFLEAIAPSDVVLGKEQSENEQAISVGRIVECGNPCSEDVFWGCALPFLAFLAARGIGCDPVEEETEVAEQDNHGAMPDLGMRFSSAWSVVSAARTRVTR